MSSRVCWIVGAGDFCPDGLRPRTGDYVIAADGGFQFLSDLGLPADMVLGDFDSLGSVPDHKNVVRHPSVKDDTDMMLAVQKGFELGYSRFALYGGLGGRLDHTLANVQTLMYISRRGGRGFLTGSGIIITSITDGTICFDASFCGYISVFCLCETARGVTLRGLKYTLERGTLEPSVARGVSNEFCGVPSSVSVENGTLVATFSGELERVLRV
ncbi:MAG: thiamine diphosphokinase [Pyramidobacter sp.]|nr:thiamine diphosphokinase [Pyramidobacter sp.]